MACADAEAAEPVALLLRQLREIKGLKEKSAASSTAATSFHPLPRRRRARSPN